MKFKRACTVLSIILPLLWYSDIYAQNVGLTVKVIVSPKIPKTDSLVIMGNQEAFGNWFDFSKGKMTRQDDTTWVFNSSFPANTSLEFQITRGSWYKTALYTYGRFEAPKVPFIIKKDTIVTIRPENWNDLFNRSITGTIKYYHNFEDHDLKYTRDVMVWLPPSYYKSPAKRYPVLYAQDGQNVFAPNSIYNGEWRMDETSDSLMRAGKTEEFIIVAINNTKDRWVEYSGTPEGIAYINFIVHNLKPFIDAHFRTKPDKNNTAAIGSSMGGLISFYMVWLHPEVFSKAACLSSGFAYDDGHIIDKVATSSKKIPGARLYLDCGDQELDKYFLTDNNRMKTLLDKKHPEAKVMYKVFKGAAHNEYAWAKRWQFRSLSFLEIILNIKMGIKCKAAITDGKGNFKIEEIVVEDPQHDEVLIKIKAAGLCHTDHDSLSWGKRLIIGHEGAGIVVKTGKDVEGLQHGDRVILSWAMHCGHCFQCLEGNQHLCEIASPVATGGNGYTPGHAGPLGTTINGEPVLRSFNIGTMAEYTLVKASAVVKNNSQKMSFPAASIISCGVMTGYGSVVNAAKVKTGSSVVVLGTGGVGLNVIQGAKIAGAAQIIAIDVNITRLAMANQFGATHIILAEKSDIGLLKAAEKVKKLTNGRGADYAFECTAIPELGAAPLAMVRNAGTAVQVSGIEQDITIDMRLFEWDKIYINPLYGKCRPQIDFPKIVSLYESGDLLLEEMITRTYTLNDLDKAFSDMLSGKNAKGVVVFE